MNCAARSLAHERCLRALATRTLAGFDVTPSTLLLDWRPWLNNCSTSHGPRTAASKERHGDGVPIGERERIFQRFARLDDSRTRGAGGAGLGLSIVDAIARDHGATIDVHDAALGGAEFVV